MVVSGKQLGRRQHRAGLVVETQELGDIADHLRKDEAVAARDTTGTERAPSRRSSSMPLWSANTLMDWNSIPRTERYSFPEAARSMRLPKDLDRFAHVSLRASASKA
jgi:hypothetical protein